MATEFQQTNKPKNVFERAKDLLEAGRIEEYTAEMAKFYENNPKVFGIVKENSPRVVDALQLINKHFNETVLPSLTKNNEHFVESWRGFLEWDVYSEKKLWDGYTSTSLYGTTGYGYVCLTDRNIKLFSFGKLAQKFAVPKGGLYGLSNFLGWITDSTKVDTEDKKIIIPYSSISDAKFSKDEHGEERAGIHSPETNINFYSADIKLLVSMIQMGIKGKLAEIWNPAPEVKTATSQEDILASIKKFSASCTYCGSNYSVAEHGLTCPHCGASEPHFLTEEK
jgi:hypothetical protein